MISEFIDQHGFVLHKSKNGKLDDAGDSTQRTFSLLFFKLTECLNDDDRTVVRYSSYASTCLDLITLPSGEIKRHWDDSAWPGRPGSMSRDNLTPIILVLALSNPRRLASLSFILFCRLGFLWNNTDISGKKKPWYVPNDWIGTRNIATILRGFMIHYPLFRIFYPLLFILDFPMLMQAIFQVVHSWYESPKKGWHTSDDLNLSLEIIFTMDHLPTVTSYWARQIYSERSPAGDENGYYDLPGPFSAWASYFRKPTAPPMHLIGELELNRISIK